MSRWIEVCGVDEIGMEDVIGFDFEGRHFAIYRLEEGVFATDGYCTHEIQDLADGFVIDAVIECPLHGGQFDCRTGKALAPPVCIDLETYPTKIEHNKVFIAL